LKTLIIIKIKLTLILSNSTVSGAMKKCEMPQEEGGKLLKPEQRPDKVKIHIN